MKTEYKIAEASETELALQLAIELATKAIITKDNPIDNSIASCRADDVKQLIRKTTKHLNPNYRRAIDRRQIDEPSWRLDRIMRKIRPGYSVDGYKRLMTAVWRLSDFERKLWIRQMEQAHGYS